MEKCELARDTGGRVIDVGNNGHKLEAAFDQIQNELRTQYLVSYTPTRGKAARQVPQARHHLRPQPLPPGSAKATRHRRAEDGHKLYMLLATPQATCLRCDRHAGDRIHADGVQGVDLGAFLIPRRRSAAVGHRSQHRCSSKGKLCIVPSVSTCV